MNNKEAIKLLQEANRSYWSLDEDKALSHAIEVMKASEWRPIDEWHEDYHDCLFAVWNHLSQEWEFEFNNPLCDSFPDEYVTFYHTWFMRPINTFSQLPQPPKEGE
jgi:hypothetical protein